jgi:hypothetical protein
VAVEHILQPEQPDTTAIIVTGSNISVDERKRELFEGGSEMSESEGCCYTMSS